MSDQSMPIVTNYSVPANSARTAALTGTDVVLGDGQTWTLADFVPVLGGVWDKIYDDNLLATRYEREDIQVATLRLLEANYDLPTDVMVSLIEGASLDHLRNAVEFALFGHRDRVRTWSDWAASALYANGIDPTTLPGNQLRPVLDSLVASGRAVNPLDWTTAGLAYKQRQALFSAFDQAGIKGTPYHPPAPPASAPKSASTSSMS